MNKYFLLSGFLITMATVTAFGQNFAEHVVGTQADGAHFVRIADMDNDGDKDLVSSSEFDSDLRLYVNNGNQAFTDNILTWVTAANLLVLDFDEDNDADIFTTCGSDGTVSWFRNLGGGSFNTAATYNESSNRSAYLVLADIDQDDDLDIISARNEGAASSNLTWHENDGYNQFAAQQTIAANTNVERLMTGDVNNDGYPEIFTVSNGSVKWYANNFGSIAVIGTTIDNTTSARTLDFADLNNDGFKDLIVGSWDFMKPLAWYRNNGGASFSAYQLISNQFSLIHQVKAADMDNDGDMDVVGSDDYGGNKIIWFANTNGNGTFGTVRTVKNGILSAHGIDIADIDDDGDLDVAATSSQSDQVLWYENQMSVGVETIDAEAIALQATFTPLSDQVLVSFTATQTDNAQLILYSMDGKAIAQQTVQINMGQNSFHLPTPNLPKGMYCLQVINTTQSAATKLMKW
jgi:hypothetical protein